MAHGCGINAAKLWHHIEPDNVSRHLINQVAAIGDKRLFQGSQVVFDIVPTDIEKGTHYIPVARMNACEAAQSCPTHKVEQQRFGIVFHVVPHSNLCYACMSTN